MLDFVNLFNTNWVTSVLFAVVPYLIINPIIIIYIFIFANKNITKHFATRLTVTELITFLETQIAYGWFKINDDQSITWNALNNSQSITWSDVSDDQTPNWTQINNSQF